MDFFLAPTGLAFLLESLDIHRLLMRFTRPLGLFAFIRCWSVLGFIATSVFDDDQIEHPCSRFNTRDTDDELIAGGDDSATQYLNQSSREQIRAKFLPIVKQATDQVGLAQQYNAFAGQAASFGVVDAKSSTVEGYVTEQALDGLFEMIAKQEASIRENPAAAATSLAKKVFGAL